MLNVLWRGLRLELGRPAFKHMETLTATDTTQSPSVSAGHIREAGSLGACLEAIHYRGFHYGVAGFCSNEIAIGVTEHSSPYTPPQWQFFGDRFRFDNRS